MAPEVIAALIGIVGITIGAIPTHLFMRQKDAAELEKHKSETDKTTAAVWDYKLGGYRVLKKLLSYREKKVLGHDLTPEEARAFTAIARLIAAILSLRPELDANFEAVIRTPVLGALGVESGEGQRSQAPDGVLDTAGNVPAPVGLARYRVLRGGSCKCWPETIHCAERSSNNPGYHGDTIGLRILVTWPLDVHRVNTGSAGIEAIAVTLVDCAVDMAQVLARGGVHHA